jgi:hypothetical protein
MALKNVIEKSMRKSLKQGYDLNELARIFVKRGYPLDEVETAVREIRAGGAKKGISISFPKVNLGLIAVIVLAVLIIGAIAGLFIISREAAVPGIERGMADCGEDKDCFIALSNECGKGTVKEVFGGSIVRYTTKNCVLEKRIESFDTAEPEEIKQLFRNKNMRCRYEEGSYNAELVDSLLGGIGDCEGELRDIIFEMRIAQEAIS